MRRFETGRVRAAFPALAVGLCLLVLEGGSAGQTAPAGGDSKPAFKTEELEQLVAPIALHPDDLLAQIFMASTYPLEIVEADRWVKKKENAALKGDALTAALEKQKWDPSVKSLVNFPQVLSMMSEKLDWMRKLGDAVLAQKKELMAAVQKLRAKAKDAGNLQTTKEQKVTTQTDPPPQTIIIESASPQVVYVPTYNPTVVYGAWPYPAYPPYYYYPPGYVAGGVAISFMWGVAVGAAWGYAWGGCHWHGGDINIDIDRNTNINHNINRGEYKNRAGNTASGKGSWQHDPGHRGGVSYRDQATAQKYQRGTSGNSAARNDYRGFDSKPSTRDAGASNRPSAGTRDSSAASKRSSSAFEGTSRGSDVKPQSNRGQSSRSSSPSPSVRSSGGRSGGGGGRR